MATAMAAATGRPTQLTMALPAAPRSKVRTAGDSSASNPFDAKGRKRRPARVAFDRRINSWIHNRFLKLSTHASVALGPVHRGHHEETSKETQMNIKRLLLAGCSVVV